MDSDSGEELVCVIREIYTGGNSQEAFEVELERALEQGYETIVIEPLRLGDETWRWISFGNCLHKTAVLTGFGSLAVNLGWPRRPSLYAATALASLFCTGLYTISWQFDPCCKYQVDHHHPPRVSLLHTLQQGSSVQGSTAASTAASTAGSCTAPVVLVRRDDSRKKILHWTVTLIAVTLCGWRLYQLHRS